MIIWEVGAYASYAPEKPELGVLYLCDAEGRDWYETLPTLDAEAYIVVDLAGRAIGVATDPSALFPVGMTVLAIVDYDPVRVQAYIADGYVYRAGAFVLTRERLVEYAAEKRWRVETGGVEVGGVRIATDDRSKTLITGGRIKADADPEHTLRFKADGGFITLDAAQIIAISDAVFAHTQAAFDAEDAVLEAISAGTITTLAEIDCWPWPGTAAALA